MKKRVVKRRSPALLSHHSTTGKRLSKEYTSYPLLLFIMLVMGVFMLGLTLKAHAADVAINASVYGTPPSNPATIVTPTDGTHFTAVPITVNGICDVGYVVKLYRNTTFSGSVICASDATFQLQTSLSNGSNDLHARIFNYADQEGPTSPVVNVIYDAPTPPPSSGGSSGGSPSSSSSSGSTTSSSSSSNSTATATGPPLVISTGDTTTKGFYVGESTQQQLDAEGGTAPYAFSISWGDGTTTAVERTTNGPFTISHVYKHAGTGTGDSYAVKVAATDANGLVSYLQLLVIIHDKNAIALALSSGITPAARLPDLNLPLQLKFIWPAYGVVMLMGSSFWLGQKRILLRVRPRVRPHKF